MDQIQLQKWVRKDTSPTWMLSKLYTRVRDTRATSFHVVEFSTRLQFTYEYLDKTTWTNLESNYTPVNVVTGTI